MNGEGQYITALFPFRSNNGLIILNERQVKVMDSRDGHGRSCCTDRDDAEGRIQSVKTQADPAAFTIAGISFPEI